MSFLTCENCRVPCMRGITTTLGGLTMDRTTPTSDTRQTFATWLDRAMTNHYGEKYKNNWLARDTDNVIREQTISRWLEGKVKTPDIHLVRLAAKTLEANLAEAYIAAGYGEIVEEVSNSLSEALLEQRETIEDLSRELAAFEQATAEKAASMRAALERARTRRASHAARRDGDHTGTH